MKKAIIIALCLIVVGAILFGLTINKFDPEKLNAFQGKTVKEVQIDKPFSSISVKDSSGEIEILPAKDGVCRVYLLESNRTSRYAEVSDDGTLRIWEKDEEGGLLDHIDFTFKSETDVALYLPEKDYNELKVIGTSGKVSIDVPFAFKTVSVDSTSGSFEMSKLAAEDLRVTVTSGAVSADGLRIANVADFAATSGNIRLSDVSGGMLSAETSSGVVKIEETSCVSLDVVATSGTISLTDTFAEQSATIEVTSGSVLLNGFDAQEIEAICTSGTIKGTLLTSKWFDATSTSGTVQVPQSDRNGGLCKLRTSSGSINISLK